MLNLLEEGRSGKHLGVVALSDWQLREAAAAYGPGIGDGEATDPDSPMDLIEQQQEFAYDLPGAIRAKIVEKCGSRRYWHEWAGDVADIARRHITRIEAMVDADEAAREVFEEFLTELRDDLNEGITEQDAIEMLAQHMITRPVFEALHGDARFVDHNPVSKGMQLVLDVLEPANIETEAESLDEFYQSVTRRANAANTPLAKQKIITDLYDNFFGMPSRRPPRSWASSTHPLKLWTSFYIRWMNCCARNLGNPFLQMAYRSWIPSRERARS